MNPFETAHIASHKKFYTIGFMFVMTFCIAIVVFTLLSKNLVLLSQASIHFLIALGALIFLLALIAEIFMSYDYIISCKGYYTYFSFVKGTIRLHGHIFCEIKGKKFRLLDTFGHDTPWVRINNNILAQLEETYFEIVLTQ